MPLRKEDYWIRPKKQLLEYQVKFFGRELEKEKRNYTKLVAEQDKRAKARGARFKTVEELEQAYIVGLVTDEEMGWQKVAIYHAYSDRGHPARIEWLEKELAIYQGRLDLLHEYMEELTKDTKRRQQHRKRSHNKRGYYRQTLEKMDEQKRIREEERRRLIREDQLKTREKKKRARKKQLKERAEKYKEILPK